MPEKKLERAQRVRFYMSLEAMLVAWSVMALAIGAALGLSAPVHYSITMVGFLVILGLAMRSRTYRAVRPLHP
jgi:hypothetical protein